MSIADIYRREPSFCRFAQSTKQGSRSRLSWVCFLQTILFCVHSRLCTRFIHVSTSTPSRMDRPVTHPPDIIGRLGSARGYDPRQHPQVWGLMMICTSRGGVCGHRFHSPFDTTGSTISATTYTKGPNFIPKLFQAVNFVMSISRFVTKFCLFNCIRLFSLMLPSPDVLTSLCRQLVWLFTAPAAACTEGVKWTLQLPECKSFSSGSWSVQCVIQYFTTNPNVTKGNNSGTPKCLCHRRVGLHTYCI